MIADDLLDDGEAEAGPLRLAGVKASKTRSRSACGMPGPLSAMVMDTLGACGEGDGEAGRTAAQGLAEGLLGVA